MHQIIAILAAAIVLLNAGAAGSVTRAHLSDRPASTNPPSGAQPMDANVPTGL